MEEIQRLIKKVKEKNDKVAANKLVSIYYKEVYIYVFRQTCDKELSMDLTQDIFISMLKSINSYEESKSLFKTWIYKIASNKIVDYYRSRYYKYSTIIEEIDDYNFHDSYNTELNFIAKENVKEIMEVVNRFEANLQQIFRLKVFGEMTFSEISKVLEVPESTVKTRYYSMTNKIKNILKESKDG